MASEVTRFRIARPPIVANGDSLKAFYYPGEQDATIFGCAPNHASYLQKAQRFLKNAAYVATTFRVEPPCAGTSVSESAPHPQAKLLFVLIRFLAWLESHAGEVNANASLEWLQANAREILPERRAPDAAKAIVRREDWKAFRVAIGDSLITAILTRADRSHIDYLTRLFRAVSILELLASDAPSDVAVEQMFAQSFILLPPWIETAMVEVKRASRPVLFTRTPAFSDLIVVRQEWSCYVPGEIAHIENVLKGEKKIRTHERLEETETKEEDETTTASTEERDTQTTDRQSLKEEAQKQTQLEIGVEGQIDTSGQYGPTRVNTHLGARLSYSVQESRSRASEQTREILSRAISRVETKVREFRSKRVLRRTTEQNSHEINNVPGEGNVAGIYRWVDKIVRLKTFRYRHRFLLEFQIPEPAAHYRWLQQNAPPPPVTVAPPPPFVTDKEANPEAADVPLRPGHLDRKNYQYYVSKFGAAGVTPPQEHQIVVSGVVKLTAEGGPTGRDEAIQFAPRASGKIELTIPDKYHATSARVSLAAHPTLARWRDQPDSSPHGYVGHHDGPDALGYHIITGAFTFAGQKLQLPASPESKVTVRGDVLRPREDPNAHLEYYDAWSVFDGEISRPRSGSFGIGKLDLGVVVGGTYEATASATVQCTLQNAAYELWQLETFDRVYAAYQAASDAYREARVTAQIQRQTGINERSPQRNAEIVREELKRQIIEMLIGERFEGYDLKTSHPVQGLVTRLRDAANVAPLIQFLEQAFEWQNMTYIMYPYYWAADEKWKDLMLIEGSDADFARFLRSGSTRVVLPARPGFEKAVMYFSIYGEPWSGSAPPIPGDELYVSVAQEIQEMTGAPDDGEPVLLWEERLPTTLVWLADSDSMPHNEHRELDGIPVTDLCRRPSR